MTGRQRSCDLQERHRLQVLLDDRLHDNLEHHLDVGRVGGRGEVVVDEFVGSGAERHEGCGDEASGRVHVAIGTWRKTEARGRDRMTGDTGREERDRHTPLN